MKLLPSTLVVSCVASLVPSSSEASAAAALSSSSSSSSSSSWSWWSWSLATAEATTPAFAAGGAIRRGAAESVSFRRFQLSLGPALSSSRRCALPATREKSAAGGISSDMDDDSESDSLQRSEAEERESLVMQLTLLTQQFELAASEIEATQRMYEERLQSRKSKLAQLESDLQDAQRAVDDVAKERSEMLRSVGEMRSKLDNVKAELSDLREKRDQARDDAERARDDVAEATATSDAARNAAQEAQDKADRIKDDVASKNADLAALRRDLVGIRSKARSDADLAVQTKEQSVSALKLERDGYVQKRDEAERQLLRLEQQLADVRNEHRDRLATKNELLEQMKKDVAQLIERHDMERSSWERSRARFEGKQALWSDERDQLREEYDVLLGEVQEIKAELDVMSAKEDEIQAKEEALRAAETNLKERTDEWDAEKADLKAKIDELTVLETEESLLRIKLKEAEVTHANKTEAFQRNLASLTGEKDAFVYKLEALQDQIVHRKKMRQNATDVMRSEYESDRIRTKQEINDILTHKSSLEQMIESLTAKLESLTKKGEETVKTLEYDLDRSESDLSTQQSIWEEERLALTREYDNLRKKVQSLRKVQNLDNEIKTATIQFDDERTTWESTDQVQLMQRIVSLESDLEAMRKSDSNFDSDLVIAKERLINATKIRQVEQDDWMKERTLLVNMNRDLTQNVRALQVWETKEQGLRLALTSAESNNAIEIRKRVDREQEMTRENASIKKKLDRLRQTEESGKDLAKTMKATEAEHRLDRSKWRSDREVLLKDKVDLLKKVASLQFAEAQVERLRSDLDAFKTEPNIWEKERSILMKDKAELLKDMDRLREEVREEEKKVMREASRSTIDATAGIIMQRQEIVKESEKALQDTETEYREMLDKVTRYEKERTSLRRLTGLGLRKVGSLLLFWKWGRRNGGKSEATA